MSVRLEGSISIPATAAAVWAELIDWEGQARWIPSSTIRAVTSAQTGVGVRVRAVHGIVVGGSRRGLVDTFVVTGWVDDTEIEVLHTGPVFTGLGVFGLYPDGPGRTRFTVVEDFELPFPVLGPLLEAGARLVRPVLEAGLAFSLRRFARLVPAQN